MEFRAHIRSSFSPKIEGKKEKAQPATSQMKVNKDSRPDETL